MSNGIKSTTTSVSEGERISIYRFGHVCGLLRYSEAASWTLTKENTFYNETVNSRMINIIIELERFGKL